MTAPSEADRAAKPLRLAVYGYFEKKSGSGAGANFMVLDALLRRGHEVHLYAIRGFVDPKELETYPGYHYHPFVDRLTESTWDVVKPVPLGRLTWWVHTGIGAVTAPRYYRLIERAIARRHAREPFDAILTMGLLCPFRTARGIPRVSWPQGPPNGEHDALLRIRPEMVERCGRALTDSLLTYYRWRQGRTRKLLPLSDFIVAGSSWTADMWRRLGAPPDRVRVIPFAVDLTRFRPQEDLPGPRPVTFLHLGRIIPRKRVDLLLAAFRLFRETAPDATLLIVGREGYGRQFSAALHDPAYRGGVEYHTAVPREKVAGLLRRADVVVQPSQNEDFGMSPAEAVSCGLPVVVGPSNGTREFFGPAAFVFPEYTPEAICRAMRAAADAVRDRRAGVAAEARAAAEQYLSIDHVTGRVEAVLREATVLAPRRGHALVPDPAGAGDR